MVSNELIQEKNIFGCPGQKLMNHCRRSIALPSALSGTAFAAPSAASALEVNTGKQACQSHRVIFFDHIGPLCIWEGINLRVPQGCPQAFYSRCGQYFDNPFLGRV